VTSILSISDTHQRESKLELPPANILVHAGDFCSHGYMAEFETFCEWLSTQTQFDHIIISPGNHDVCVEANPGICRVMIKNANPKATLLIHEALRVADLNFFASPYTKKFGVGWAYNVATPEGLRNTWAAIPDDTDVLVAHQPPLGFGDFIPDQKAHVGCYQLANKITQSNIRLSIHGHIHEGYGVYPYYDKLTILNASQMNERYRLANKPILMHLDPLSTTL
jgi:3',5'-cyclic AMP phosphodiesterase CpdA